MNLDSSEIKKKCAHVISFFLFPLETDNQEAIFKLNQYLFLQTDIHLHCDEWDRVLDEGNWEPQQIVAKLPKFLEFLREVQRNVSP